MEHAKFVPYGKRKYEVVCAVRDCRRKSHEDLNLTFHRFPKEKKTFVTLKNRFGNDEKVDQRRAWMEVTKVKKPHSGSAICSRHFKKTDYVMPDFCSKRRRLKIAAVPSLNLPTDVPSNVLQKQKTADPVPEQMEHSDNQLLPMPIPPDIDSDCHGPTIVDIDCVKNEPVNVEENLIVKSEFDDNKPVLQQMKHFDSELSPTPPDTDSDCYERTVVDIDCVKNEPVSVEEYSFIKSEFHDNENEDQKPVFDIAVQVNSDHFAQSFPYFIENDNHLSTATGIQSFDILNYIVDIVSNVYTEDRNSSVRMSLRDKVLMTYVKLKQNISYSFLAVLFKPHTAEHCARIFKDMISLLNSCLQVAVSWPSREEISKNILCPFEQFSNVRVVLDSTEIQIDDPNNSTRAVKIMTGVTPAGNISFISEPFGGQASDKDIFVSSKLLHLLEPGDTVMVDKDFLIDETCRQQNLKFVRSPILRDKKQFLKSEANETGLIPFARAHVELLKARLKTFKILGKSLPNSLVPVAKEIFTVICATINLSSQFIKQ